MTVTLNCAHCDEPFRAKRYDAKTCSTRCRVAFHRNRKPVVLDLFCCEGGASTGYVQAGYDVIGIDLDPNRLRHYPYESRLMDWKSGLEKFAGRADFIHASPPCQRYSSSTPRANQSNYPDLVADVRTALTATGKPWVIENVPQAPLLDPVFLTGCMFDLRAWWRPSVSAVTRAKLAAIGPGITTHGNFVHLERKRGFETNWPLVAPAVDPQVHATPSVAIVGHSVPTGSRQKFWNASSLPTDVRRELMGMPWATRLGMSEAIPPAYARYIAEQWLAQ